MAEKINSFLSLVFTICFQRIWLVDKPCLFKFVSAPCRVIAVTAIGYRLFSATGRLISDLRNRLYPEHPIIGLKKNKNQDLPDQSTYRRRPHLLIYGNFSAPTKPRHWKARLPAVGL